MFLNYLFCCSNSTIYENKAITFEKLNINEDNNYQNSIISPCINIERNQDNYFKVELDKIDESIDENNDNFNNNDNSNNNSINYNLNNSYYISNNIKNRLDIKNKFYFNGESSNKLQKNNVKSINSKGSFKSLLVKNYKNNHNNNQLNNRFKSNNNVNNFQSNNNLQKTQSKLSFSNLVVTKTKNTNNYDDTEILSPYELILSGEIFYNKEIKIDRLGIKSNRMGDKTKRKEHIIKFGVLLNNKNKDSDYNTSKYKSKIEKEYDKNNQNLIADLNSLSSSFLKKSKEHNLDMILNIDNDKVIKMLDQYEQIVISENKEDEDLYSPKIRMVNKGITLFTIKYISSMELFEFCSTHKSIPVQLLLDYEYQLRNGYDYNILLGEVCIILKVLKNINDEDILRIIIKNKIDEKNNNNDLNNNKKQEEIYNFNSSNNINQYISIGRKNCAININNDTLNDIHLKIRYSNNTDTFSIIDNNTKNGSYLLLNEPFNFLYIKNILSFRLFESKFKIKFIHSIE